jgi:uncharacterized membrane protein YjjB (DUF3815 family)
VEADMLASFGNTLTLTKSGAVFPMLPGGANVSASDFNLVNNQFTPVPEPSSWALVIGVLSLGIVWSRRR